MDRGVTERSHNINYPIPLQEACFLGGRLNVPSYDIFFPFMPLPFLTTPNYVSILQEQRHLLSGSKKSKLRLFCLLNNTLVIAIYCNTNTVTDCNEMCTNITISTSNFNHPSYIFLSHGKAPFLSFPTPSTLTTAHRSYSCYLVFAMFIMPSLHVSNTQLLGPTLASQALPWDMSALKCLSSRPAGPACHQEDRRSWRSVLGSPASQGTQALRRHWGCRCQLSCAPGLTLSMRGHFTFITASKPELMILKTCFCLSRCMWLFPSTKRNKSKRFQTGCF